MILLQYITCHHDEKACHHPELAERQKKKELARQKKTNKKDEMNLQLMIESYDDKVNTNDSQCAAKTNHK